MFRKRSKIQAILAQGFWYSDVKVMTSPMTSNVATCEKKEGDIALGVIFQSAMNDDFLKQQGLGTKKCSKGDRVQQDFLKKLQARNRALPSPKSKDIHVWWNGPTHRGTLCFLPLCLCEPMGYGGAAKHCRFGGLKGDGDGCWITREEDLLEIVWLIGWVLNFLLGLMNWRNWMELVGCVVTFAQEKLACLVQVGAEGRIAFVKFGGESAYLDV